MNTHYGFWSLLPIFVAIFVAVKTRKVILALFLGVYVGVLTLENGNPVAACASLVSDYLVQQLTDDYNATVLVLLVFIGGFVRLMERSGGAIDFAERVSASLHTKRRALTASWLGGVLVFFSDLGTPLIVGPVFEPLFDKLRISREKLAWVLDGTASPVAVLVPITGWAVYIMGLLAKEFERLPSGSFGDWQVFVEATAINFFPILTVFSIPLLSWMAFDLPPMRRAEERASRGMVHAADARPLRVSSAMGEAEPRGHASFVWMPLLVLFASLVSLLVPHGFPFEPVPGSRFRVALSLAYFFAALALASMMIVKGKRRFEEIHGLYFEGIERIVSVAAILLLAWSMSQVSQELGTANYVVELTQANLGSGWVPPLVFVTACIMSFATGSSWGSFAILFPLVIPLAPAMGLSMPMCVAAVLSGGLFGDHASPISDTTILASTGAGCDHIDHTRTQLPYAGIAALAAFCGFVVLGGGSPAWLAWLIVLVAWAGTIAISARLRPA